MTQDHSSKLSFSIEESVWLNKGQEVDEIVSLSLDPEITVEENGEYVLIRGGLKLTGEYRSNGNEGVTDEESVSLSNQVAFRSIEEVTLNEDGTGEIRHHFPIDVTIPQERIKSLDDIYVIVEAFDYDLPERGCIQLTADVAITGMSTGRITGEEMEHVVGEEVEEVNGLASEELTDERPIEDEDRSFHFEAYNKEEKVDDEVVDESEEHFAAEEGVTLQDEDYENRDEDELETTQEEVELVEPIEQVEVEVKEVDVTVEVNDDPQDNTPSIAFGVIKDRPKEAAVVEEEKQPEEEGQPAEQEEKSFGMLKSLAGERKRQQKIIAENKRAEQESTTEEEVAFEDPEVIEAAKNAGKAEVTENAPPREENALYLTKMLTKGEEEEFKKLKMCIIQEDETLDLIANRYKVNESTLIRVNHLNDTNVEEGQILYIPVPQ